MLAAGCRQRLARFWGECYGQRQNDDQAHYESQGFRPAVVSHKYHPLSALSRREWLTACLQQTPAGFPRHFLLYGPCRFKSMCFLLLWGFSALFRPFWLGKFSPSTKPAPPFLDLVGRTGQHRLFPASGCAPPIHSKTACRGFKSFCPCQKSQVSLLRYLTFSLVCGRIWQRGAPAGPPAVRVVGACSPVGCVQARPRRQPRQVLLPLPKKSGIASAVPDFFVSVR